MIISTVILTKDNFYVTEDGRLPTRASFDKKLLTSLCKGQHISHDAYEMLPNSIRNLTHLTSDEPTIGITIKEIDVLTDLLIVVHSNELITRGKQFRLDKFELLVKDRKVSLYIRK